MTDEAPEDAPARAPRAAGRRRGAGPAPTLAVMVRDRLLDDITRGIFEPGERLEEEDLAGRYSVSRTPIREALRQLATTGAVEIRARQGVLVARLDDVTRTHTLEVLADLEASAARYAALRMSTEQRAALRAAHQRMTGIVRSQDKAGFDRLNAAFHRLIREGSGNAVLAETIDHMRRRMLPYTRVQRMASAQPMAVSFDEHGAIVRAIERGEENLAYFATRDHVLRAGRTAEDAAADPPLRAVS
jgi:DNA-binding GntR family transcriptional regulator